jgi:hypothetical protein
MQWNTQCHSLSVVWSSVVTHVWHMHATVSYSARMYACMFTLTTFQFVQRDQKNRRLIWQLWQTMTHDRRTQAAHIQWFKCSYISSQLHVCLRRARGGAWAYVCMYERMYVLHDICTYRRHIFNDSNAMSHSVIKKNTLSSVTFWVICLIRPFSVFSNSDGQNYRKSWTLTAWRTQTPTEDFAQVKTIRKACLKCKYTCTQGVCLWWCRIHVRDALVEALDCIDARAHKKYMQNP